MNLKIQGPGARTVSTLGSQREHALLTGRLTGTLLGVKSIPSLPLSAEGQAHRLIGEATDKENLGSMYIWCACVPRFCAAFHDLVVADALHASVQFFMIQPAQMLLTLLCSILQFMPLPKLFQDLISMDASHASVQLSKTQPADLMQLCCVTIEIT